MIENIKELEKFLKLCRKQGVIDITWGTLSLRLGDIPLKADGSIEESEDPLTNFPEGELTTEELTFFANGGLPEDNPYRQ